MQTIPMTIDGAAVAGESRFGVIDPASGEVFAEAADKLSYCRWKPVETRSAALRGLVGGLIGGVLGAGIGAIFGPIGALVGGLAGIVAGAIIGAATT